jgi:hypothetical protein
MEVSIVYGKVGESDGAEELMEITFNELERYVGHNEQAIFNRIPPLSKMQRFLWPGTAYQMAVPR